MSLNEKGHQFITELIEKMTVKEKVGQVNQKLYGWEAFKKEGNDYVLTEQFKEHVKWGEGLGALYGLFRADPWSQINYENGISKEDSHLVAQMVQDYVNEHTRLKIPVLFSEECPHGHQALDGEIYPSNIGVGSTWNKELLEEVAADIAVEIRSKGANLGLISTLDITRDPRWGRTEESYGEDPYLASIFSRSVVRGMQGDIENEFIPNNKIGALLKVLCGHGGSQGGLNAAASNMGEREMREIHLPTVKMAASEEAIGAMVAYNEIDGVPCHSNKKLLTDIVKGEFDFTGFLMADGGALDRLFNLTGGNREAAANLGLEAGVDLSLWDQAYMHIEAGVENGIIDEKVLDRAVYRVLAAKYKLGLFNEGFERPIINEAEQRARNLQLAKESLVLLKNEKNVLPFSKKVKKIAVIGPNADTPYNQLGDYTPPKRPGDVVTLLQGITNVVSAETEVTYTRGCGIRNHSQDGFAEAIRIAKEADVVVLALGGSSARDFSMEFHDNGAFKSSEHESEMNSGENVDLADLNLEGAQNALAQEIYQLGKPVATVLIQGRPHAIEQIRESGDSILCAWYPGQQGGQAIAEVLFGEEAPSGRLSISVPRSSSQLPVFYNKKNDGSRLDYVDMTSQPAYPFGYGLSYTEFNYENLQVESSEISLEELQAGETFKISIDITNTGDVAAKEVGQLYIRDLEASILRRYKELKGFEKQEILPKETKTFVFELGLEELSIWDINMDFSLEKGNVKVMIGKNSEEILAETTITII